jgi:hypothetical protein
MSHERKNRDGVADRLPHSPEAERAILGAILLGTTQAIEALDGLESQDFFLPFHRVVFRHMKQLRRLGIPTNDVLLLHDSLEQSHELDEAGGAPFVASLTDGIARVSNPTYYAEIVKTRARARSAIHLLDSQVERLLRANGDLAAVLQDVSSLSAHIGWEFGQKEIDLFKTAPDLAAASPGKEPIVEPYLLAGTITELTAKIKAGKTSYALGELVRKALVKGPVIYLTEQPSASFRAALERANLLEAGNLFVLSSSAVAAMDWPGIARLATGKSKQVGAVLLVVDTVSHFAGLEGDSENDSGAALTTMKPLQEAAEGGTAVLTIRHERKSGGEIGDAGRGSSAFGGAADTLLSLRRLEGRARSTLRKIECVSRFDGLPPEAIFEYSNGQYEYRGTEEEISEREAESVILAAASESEEDAKELSELLEGSEVARTTAQRVLKRLVSEGRLARTGRGRRNDPFRYFKSVSAQTAYIYGQKETGAG